LRPRFFACAEATGHKGVGGAVGFGPPPESAAPK